MTLGFFFFVASVAVSETGWVSLVLSWEPVAYVGRISYGMYLYQGLIIGVVKHVFHIPFNPSGYPATRMLFPGDLLLTIGLAALSFRFLEQPVLRWAETVTSRMEKEPSEQRLATTDVENIER